MSLINKMLRDLDARNVTAGERTFPSAVRPLPAQMKIPLISRGIVVFLGITTVVVVGFVTSPYWLQPLLDMKLVPQKAVPVATAPAPQPVAPPPPTTVVLQLPPPEQMLPMPILPEAEPAATPEPPPAAESARPADVKQTRPVEVAQAARGPVSENRRHNRKFDGELAEALRGQPSVPPLTAQPAPQRQPPKAVVADKAGTSSGPITIDKQARVTRSQEQAEIEYRKGVAAYKQGHASEAAVQFRAALREEPRHLAARQTLLSLMAEQKQWDEAQTLLKEGLELMPQQIAWAMALARIQVERDNAAGAWDTLLKYMVYGEKSADYRGFSGVLLQRLQKPKEAAIHYQAAVQLKPTEGRWWLGLGLAYEADGRKTEARDAFQHAKGTIGLSPEMLAVIEQKLR